VDVANELRKAAAAHGSAFAISEQVYTAAGLAATFEDKVVLRARGSDAPIAASLSATPPSPPPLSTRPGKRSPRAALQRLWSG
jgi:class 3 adenylate cyclase